MQLRYALLHHPSAGQDKINIYIESASYCRQNRLNAREFIIFNLRDASTGSGVATPITTTLILDQPTGRDLSMQMLGPDLHSGGCLPLFTTLLGFLKPGYWKSLKEPARFYIPNEGCLDDLLQSRGLGDYVESDKITFKSNTMFNLEHLIVWISTLSKPDEFYRKRLAQSSCWFSTILWNAMTRISLSGAEPATGIQKIDNVTLERIFGRVEADLARFRADLARAQAKKSEQVRLEQRRKQSLLEQRRELEAEREKAH
ncbi:hypothetical protein CTheo_7076 [Ceratobasidium theobromae]|uniref:Uncharacterized protein n=1 Tax=Ceratobasidium theobromae TaxID=1582974 RepID=A0A5N5QDF4_9AGAM|nr:hypothetical protein CTheo_7076 [Ceratobasidium theobromae]